jgi:ubiquinone/menaquinone biosynthesis C-methylase UbiE/uncharacterized membrane protein YbhN (UPF0104 family)
MPVSNVKTAPAARRPPRAMAWVLLLASASAFLLVGLTATTLVLGDTSLASVPPVYWLLFAAACGLTLLSLMLRSLRWVFLLRRTAMRVPIRDAYIGYLAGLSLLLAPLLVGEMAVRAAILRVRGGVPVATTVVLNLWERLLDLTALALIAGLFGLATGRDTGWSLVLLGGAVAVCTPWVRRLSLGVILTVSRPVARRFDAGVAPEVSRLARTTTWTVGLGSSVAAWTLPGLGLWCVASTWPGSFSLSDAQHTYALSASLGGLVLAPGGVLVAGTALLEGLGTAGFPAVQAALIVFGIRMATLGMATALGGLFVLIHLRTAHAAGASHFDEIADAYDVQIPESRREALLVRKTDLMREVLEQEGAGRRGLDVGCGQGAYLARMRALGFDVSGIDTSAGQIERAWRRLGKGGLVTAGSVLQIPAADDTYDFAYVINVLHHLASVEEQRRGFAELLRVLKPGGLLFVHEINTRNILFRFYMGYVFPSLNCIDEGVERWLRPDGIGVYTDARPVDLRYFTFLPEFTPRPVVTMLAPIERVLEGSPLRVYSAHYMAVLRKARANG